jgi:hypothetical protein
VPGRPGLPGIGTTEFTAAIAPKAGAVAKGAALVARRVGRNLSDQQGDKIGADPTAGFTVEHIGAALLGPAGRARAGREPGRPDRHTRPGRLAQRGSLKHLRMRM